MDIELLKDYASLKRQMAALEEQEKVLKVAVMAELEKNKLDKAETEFGRFSLATRKNYSYSGKVEEMEEKVKLAKLKEVEKGVARVNETHYLLFKEPKI